MRTSTTGATITALDSAEQTGLTPGYRLAARWEVQPTQAQGGAPALMRVWRLEPRYARQDSLPLAA